MQTRPQSDPQDSHLISAANVLTKAMAQSREAKRKEWKRDIFVFDIISERFREGGYYLNHEDIALLRCISPNENVLTFMEMPANTRLRLIFQRQLILKHLLELTENSSALSAHLLNYLAQMPLIGSESRSTWYLDTNPAFITGPNVRVFTRLIPEHVIANPLRSFYRNNHSPELLEILTPNMTLGFSGRTLIEAEGLSQLEIDQYHHFAGYHLGKSNQQPPSLLTRLDLRLLSDYPVYGEPGQFNLMLTLGSYSIAMNENAYVSAMLLLMSLGMIAILNRSALFTLFKPQQAEHAPAAQHNSPSTRHTR